MSTVEKYLKPSVINQIKRLDLRAQFVVRGFLQGLHASPFQGFSVEFAEHRRYTPGDDPKDLDWLVYAKTDKYYVKKYEAETNITGYLALDLSRSMGYTHRQELTKFDYAICLAASLGYLMIYQHDPCGLVTFDDKVRDCLSPKTKRTHLGAMISLLSKLQPSGGTNFAKSLGQLSAMLKQRSLVMLFSDLLADPDTVIPSLRRLRHGGHDVIVFHILDEAEVHFPFSGLVELEDPESGETIVVDAESYRRDFSSELAAFREIYTQEAKQSGIDFVPLDTSMQFDRALMEYLMSRRGRR